MKCLLEKPLSAASLLYACKIQIGIFYHKHVMWDTLSCRTLFITFTVEGSEKLKNGEGNN